MKILTILGSPRKKGNTAAVLAMVESELAVDHTIERLDITDADINGCLGCGLCRKTPDHPGCDQNDGALAAFERMMSADAVIYTSPLYCWGFSAQMKALIDRHFCLVNGFGTPAHRSLIDDKPVALLVTCGGPVAGNADVIQTVFDRVCNYGKARLVNMTVVPFCTTPDALGDDARAAARKLAGDIRNALRR